jgi:ribosome-binding factor A
MGSIRQQKIDTAIKKELSVFFQQHARDICLGNMISVNTVKITSDLSLARVYLSIFGLAPKDEVMEKINENASKIRGAVGVALKNMKKMPHLSFHIDDSLDYAENIDALLKK